MSEWDEQKELIKWFKTEYPEHEKCISLSMSGCNFGSGKKAAMMINQLKSQGWVKGEADLRFLVARQGFHGLVVEFKAMAGTHPLTDEQSKYLDYMQSQGYLAVCIKGLEAAKMCIAAYFKEEE